MFVFSFQGQRQRSGQREPGRMFTVMPRLRWFKSNTADLRRFTRSFESCFPWFHLSGAIFFFFFNTRANERPAGKMRTSTPLAMPILKITRRQTFWLCFPWLETNDRNGKDTPPFLHTIYKYHIIKSVVWFRCQGQRVSFPCNNPCFQSIRRPSHNAASALQKPPVHQCFPSHPGRDAEKENKTHFFSSIPSPLSGRLNTESSLRAIRGCNQLSVRLTGPQLLSWPLSCFIKAKQSRSYRSVSTHDPSLSSTSSVSLQQRALSWLTPFTCHYFLLLRLCHGRYFLHEGRWTWMNGCG